MSKQLEGILGRATRATPVEAAKLVVAAPQRLLDREELLQARIPSSVKRAVAKLAFERGQTVRAFLLECLRSSGVPVTDDQLRDRRK